MRPTTSASFQATSSKVCHQGASVASASLLVGSLRCRGVCASMLAGVALRVGRGLGLVVGAVGTGAAASGVTPVCGATVGAVGTGACCPTTAVGDGLATIVTVGIGCPATGVIWRAMWPARCGVERGGAAGPADAY